jgi:uncharacterized protein (DUF2141 family)
MKRAATLAGLALAALPAAAQAQDPVDGNCAAGGGAEVRVNVSGLKDRSGRLKLELYPANEADFLKDDRDLKKEGKAFRRIWAPMPAAGPVSLCIQAPHAGRWALLFTHDRDGRNKFNFWQDGAGFVSAQRMGRSRPKLAQAAIAVPGDGASVTVRVQYLRGISGFAPVSNRR